MPSATSSFEWKGWFQPTLFRKNLTRFWPLWVGYTVILFFALPMELLQVRIGHTGVDATALLAGLSFASVGFGVVYGLLMAMALFFYLMDPRACQLYHTLPIRREGLFLTNWLSGLCFCAVPNAAIALIATAVGLVCGLPVFPDICLWFLIQTTVDMFFFCFAVFCAMFTGNLLALPVFYGILNVLFVGIAQLTDTAMSILLIGYSGSNGSNIVGSTFVRWCTPAYNLLELLSPYPTEDSTYTLYRSLNSPVGAICYCICVGATFIFLAVMVYRFRQLERVGDLVTVGWVQPVFQYGFGVCFGMTAATIINYNFFEGPVAYISQVVLWSVVGAFAGRMLLKKTLKVFRDGWKGILIFAGVVLLVFGGARADFFGYQRFVPAPNDVKNVQFYCSSTTPWDRASNPSVTLDDLEDIAAVTEFHTALVGDLAALQKSERVNFAGKIDDLGYEIFTVKYAVIDYTMKDGSRVERSYSSIPITSAGLLDENAPTAKLQALVNRKNYVKEAYFRGLELGEGETMEPVGGWLSNIKQEETEQDTNAPVDTLDEDILLKTVETTKDRSSVSFDQTAAEKLWAAVQADMEAGNLGRRYVLDNEARYQNCYQTNLTINLMRKWKDKNGAWKTSTSDFEISLQVSAKQTMAVLEELGYADLLLPWDMPKT